MTPATILGFAGDILTFLGGIVLALDALRREKEFRKQKNWVDVVKRLKNVELTKDGIRLLDQEAVELVFIRLSVRRSIWGTAIITLGFLSLLASRILETMARSAGHGGG